LTILSLTFFQSNCYFGGKRVICDISAHRLIFALPTPPPYHVSIKRAVTQKEWLETIAFSQFSNSFTHLFFPLNCYFWGKRAICDISVQMLIFAPLPPPDCIYINRMATQEEW
jgi:hypothetical protein